MKQMRQLMAAVALAAMLQGCAATDPLLNANDWHPTGANDANLAAEVVNPTDLVHGRAPSGGSDGQLATAAVLRLRTGHVKALPNSGLTDFQVQTAPAGAAGP